MFGRPRKDSTVTKALLEAVEDQARDLAVLRLQVARMAGKFAVATREARRKTLSPEEALLEQLTGGRIVGTVTMKDGQPSYEVPSQETPPDGD